MPKNDSNQPLVGVVMGSKSDWETMRHAAETLDELGIGHETKIVSAHRTPDRMFAYAEAARGLVDGAADLEAYVRWTWDPFVAPSAYAGPSCRG